MHDKRSSVKTGRLVDPNAATEYALTAITPVQKTENMIAVDKTTQFCSFVNTGIRQRFFCVNITIHGSAYQVLRIHKIQGTEHIRVFFLDYEGRVWNWEESCFKAFTIFRGI